jgi:hypothetical protein
MMWSDIKKAVLIVWVTVSVTLAAAALAPLVASPQAIVRLAPRCEAKSRYGRECFLCGATTGFLAIAHGDFAGAQAANRASVPMYFAFLSNAAGTLFAIMRRFF